MKKIILLSIFFCSFLLLAGNVWAVDCCNDANCPSGQVCIGADANCILPGSNAGIPLGQNFGTCGSSSPAPPGGTGTGGTGGVVSSEMSECIKLRAEVKIKEGNSTKTFEKDTVIAPYKITSDAACKYGKVETNGKDGCTKTQRCYTSDFGIIIVLAYLNFITAWLFYILMLLSTIFIIYGGFLVVTAAGDPEKANKGKKIVMFAVIGLAVALLARLIPSLVRFVIGV